MTEEQKQKRRERDRKWRETNQEQERERNRKWREENPDYNREYRKVHREKLNEQAKNRYKVRQEQTRGLKLRREKVNPEMALELTRKYRQEYYREYYRANREKQLVYMRNLRESQLNHCVYLLELPDCRMYVGSTNLLSQRLIIHRKDSIRFPERPLYRAITESGGWDQVRVHVLMRDISDEDLRLKLEQHFINLVPENLRLNQVNTVKKA